MHVAVYIKNTPAAFTSKKIIVSFESLGDQFFFESLAMRKSFRRCNLNIFSGRRMISDEFSLLAKDSKKN